MFAYNSGIALDLLQSLYLIFGLGLLFGIIMLGVLDRFILARLGILTGAVMDIGENRSFTGRVVLTGDDELAVLAHSINGMLEQLEIAKQRLKDSEERYFAIIEDQTEFISRFLPDGTHLFANDAYCRYFHKSCSEIIGKKFTPDIPAEDRAKMREHFASFRPGAPVLTIEHRLILPDGELRWQQWTDRAIYGAEGKIMEFQSVGRDITDRKRAEEVLHQANQKLNILGSVTRHDVINLIQALRSYLELSVDLNREAAISGYLARAADISLRIQKLIEFTRDYQNMGVKEPRWHPLDQLVRNVGVNFPSVHLVTRVPGLEIFADPLLEKVFYNLMDNSIRHGGHITTVTIDSLPSDTAFDPRVRG
ncbi:MAG: PAS domain S-box protein [Methanomicrobiales archaeon]|nr:PAS domain S-box protein [Methanomicrobiales archaeon]